jgi:16S rRNA (adenine1518-N6/adenine1519-N6)-dimethyltransferase
MKNKIELGQNFLKNDIVAEKLSSYVSDQNDVNLLEIGGGAGALTRHFINLKYNQFRIVELDKDLIGRLKRVIDCRRNVFIDNMNVLDYKLPNDEFAWNIVGNIPFNITFKIIERMIEWSLNINSIVFIVQEEVAQKLYRVGGKGYGPISVLAQYFFSIELLDKLSPKDFQPEPKVSSRIIRLIPKGVNESVDIDGFSKFLSVIFRLPRKKIKNNIVGTIHEKCFNEDILNKRAQELDLRSLIELYKECL